MKVLPFPPSAKDLAWKARIVYQDLGFSHEMGETKTGKTYSITTFPDGTVENESTEDFEKRLSYRSRL